MNFNDTKEKIVNELENWEFKFLLKFLLLQLW